MRTWSSQIPIRQLCCREIRNHTWPARHTIEGGVVRDDDDTVFGDVNIGFQNVGSGAESSPKRSHSVLSVFE